jgi:hypothetical protein
MFTDPARSAEFIAKTRSLFFVPVKSRTQIMFDSTAINDWQRH